MRKVDADLVTDRRVIRTAEYTGDTPRRVVEQAEAMTTFNGDTVDQEVDAAYQMVTYLEAYDAE